MNKKGTWALWISIILIVVLVIAIFLYFTLYSPGYDAKYVAKFNSGELVNPVSKLSVEEAKAQFNESFVYYLLYSIKAYNLHNAPLSYDSPKIEIFVGDDAYSAEIIKGEIIIARGEIAEKDIIIKTSKIEAIKMLQNKNYVQESFVNGGSEIEKVASQSSLFGKGYLKLYNEINGKSVTGNVIRIYVG